MEKQETMIAFYKSLLETLQQVYPEIKEYLASVENADQIVALSEKGDPDEV